MIHNSWKLDRLKMLSGCIFILGALIIGRLFEVQVLGYNYWKALARDYTKQDASGFVERGKILLDDGEGFPLVTNVTRYRLIGVPAKIEDLREFVQKLSSYLGIDWAPSLAQTPLIIEENEDSQSLKNLLARLSRKNDFYELLKKDLTIDQVNEIKELNLEGVDFEPYFKRWYPEKELFSHVTGFVSQEKGKGAYGLEEFFEKELSDGQDLVLTLDRSIQFFASSILKKAVLDYEAEGGTIIVISPESGAILALCNKPTFDSNEYSKVKNFELFKNPAVASNFEPGSIFKVITMAAVLEEDKVTPDTIYEDKGEVKIGDYVIRNSDNKVWGFQSMKRVLEVSINTGAVFAARQIGLEKFRSYVKKFGFGSLTELGLAGEASGDVSNLARNQEIYLATASYGQGITVTPIQMVNAISAIANQGKLNRPYIVDRFIKAGGEVVRQEPKFIRQVISPSTAIMLGAMMVSVIENGYGRRAGVPGYFVAGKTGTAQVPAPGGQYSERVIHSFVGFAPATHPVFAALIKLDNPKKGRFADSTAAPTFGELAEFILRYYNVPPDREK